MWYVKNRENGKILKKFEKKVIIPLFQYMLAYKKMNCTKSFMDFLVCEQRDNENKLSELEDKKNINCYRLNQINSLNSSIQSLNILRYVCNTRVKKETPVSDYIDKILSSYPLDMLVNQIACYYLQNKELKNKASNISDYSTIIAPEWRNVFVDCFYTKLFNRKTLWNKLDINEYNRKTFHNNFRDENDIFVCPYCDSLMIIDEGIVDIDHFWPSSKYPFLAMNYLNLFSCCKACNSKSNGKGDRTFSNIIMPSFTEINKKVHFSPDVINHQIKVIGSDDKTNNFISLVNLTQRYSKPHSYMFINESLSRKYATFLETFLNGTSVTEKDIEGYINRTMVEKHEPYFLITKDVLRSHVKYSEFLDDK